MNYNHLMEKYELYGGIFVHLTKVKKIQPNLFPICNTLWNSQRRHKKSSNRNGQLHFFFQNFSSQRSFFWNRESFNKMFTQSAYVSFFLFYVSFFCSLNLCFLFFQFLLYIHNFIFLRLMVWKSKAILFLNSFNFFFCTLIYFSRIYALL